MNDFSNNFCCYLSGALDSGYFCCKELVDWADRKILQCEVPKIWLVNLSLVKCTGCFYSLEEEGDSDLRASLNKECLNGCSDEGYEGFLFLKYLEGRVDEAGVLSSYGEKTTFDDVAWSDLLPEMKRQGPLAENFLKFMRRDDLYEVAPEIFNA
ncbi:hypothetical protein E8K88_13110 [Lampropedia aestuarii]|uniref:Uncharacterized protein n=1 Tax=Lampropedia aestuarii TaxID=2562762 RepID=A0A4S5BMU9_9BURK|nr:hypothetical protein [Lampropedia aestuarii]THJ32181.1 hypothetical protein E8K88_13110 [Lampropedia aestuarii]